MTKENASNEPQSDEEFITQFKSLLVAVARIIQADELDQKPKAWWRPFLESSVLAASVTVVIGGLAGGLITHFYQEAEKDKEIQQLSYKEYVSQEQDAVKHAYSLIGECVGASKRLINTTGASFRGQSMINSLSEDELKHVTKQIVDTKHNFNETHAKWQVEQVSVGLLMDYYHPDQAAIIGAWREAEGATTAFMECAANWDFIHGQGSSELSTQELQNACRGEEDYLTTRLAGLTTRLEESRRYSWDQRPPTKSGRSRQQ
jgi:hypothetical protein